MSAPSDGDEATRDEILRGRLALWQPKSGYRFNVDSLLLAHFAAGDAASARVADLCAGVGVIGLALAIRGGASSVTLAELQPRMAGYARRNVAENGLAACARVVEVDLSDEKSARAALPGASFDLVVSSPPYFAREQGPPVPSESEAIARHELAMSLADLAREARRLLVPNGRAAIVFPSERLVQLLAILDGEGLRPTRLRAIHPRPGAAANRVLVAATKGSRAGLTVEPPWFVRDDAGAYTAESRDALGEP